MAGFTVSSAESCSEMVFDVTRLLENICTCLWRDTLEFSHDDFHGLAHNVGKRIKTSSMRHSNYEGTGTILDRRVNAELKARNERFASLKTKALHSVKFAGHEGTPLVSPV